ncbi:PAS domain S-box protein [Flectobacillus rivi]|uniref:histidine kinase n=1 Tax=Flectobacillus rivi TaxID=2984209 RepID=A0ABT6Z975_9BACT|nr:PAS domain S-box protein [Flectobacillus rivi]MDI9877136.1 PAS domain S-box protein [Flectobacillus rivi]
MEAFTNTESQLSENTTTKNNVLIEQENPAIYQALDFANEAILIYNKNQENIYQNHQAQVFVENYRCLESVKLLPQLLSNFVFQQESESLSTLSNEYISSLYGLKARVVQSSEQTFVYISLNPLLAQQQEVINTIISPDFNPILNQSNDILCLTTASGNILKINRAASTSWGYAVQEFQHKNILSFLTESSAGSIKEAFESLSQGQPIQNVVLDIRKKDGSVFPMIWNAVWNHQQQSVIAIAKDISESLVQEKALKISEQNYSYLFNNNPLPMWINDFYTKEFIEVNDATLRQYGYSREELTGMTVYDIIAPEQLESYKNTSWDFTTNPPNYRGISVHKTKSGNPITVDITAHQIEYKNRTVSLVLVHDITLRKLAEKELIQTNNRLKAAQEIAHLAYWEHDLRTGKVFWSEEVFKIFEITENKERFDYEDFIGMVHPEDRMSIKLLEVSVLYGSKPIEKEFRIILASGKIKYLFSKTQIVFDTLGNALRIDSTFLDITLQKQAKQALRKSNERFELAKKATRDIIWDWDIVTGDSYWSDNYEFIFGKYPYGPMKDFQDWSKNIYAEDKERVLDEIQLALANPEQTTWECEYRYIRANGEIAYVSDKGYMVFDNHGKPIRMVGAMRDITKEKEEEQQLNLWKSVITNSNDAILITEAEPIELPGPRIIYANEAFTKMTGYELNEIIGKSPRILQGPASNRYELNKIRAALKKWEPCEVEVINYKKNKEPFWVNISIVPLADETGWFTHWISIQKDITERKKNEEERELLIRELTQINQDLRQFSYITSHNIRSPLSNLLGLLKMLNTSTITDPMTLKVLEGFKTSTNQLNDTINDLLKILVIKENVNVQQEVIAFETVWNKITQMTQQLIQDAGTSITTNFDKAPLVNFNISYLESILLNLLSNALKYRSNKRPLEIWVKTRNTSKGIELIFIDNGLGIDLKRHKNKVFGLYQRFHNHPDSKGIGLYMVQAQVKSLGGNISVKSEVDKGTQFSILFKK